MSRGVGELIGGADVNPPALFPNPQARLILVKHGRFDQCRFQVLLYPGQVLMTRFDKAGDAARRELHAEQILEELAGTRIRHRLAFYERNGQRLNAGSILSRGFDQCRKAGSCQMKTGRALSFFDAMLRHPEAFGWQIDHLPSLCNGHRTGTQILLTVFALLDGMHQDRIGRLHLSAVMSPMALLATWLVATLLLQTLRGTHKPIRRRRQVAVVAIFGLLPFEDFDTFLQHIDLSFQ